MDTALPLDKAIQTLISQEKNRLSVFEYRMRELLDLFRNVQVSKSSINEEKGNRFQILQGLSQINNKVKEMASDTEERFFLLGSKDEFLHFHHVGIFELLKNSKTDVKILSSHSKKTRYFLNVLQKDHTKTVSDKYTRGLCFAIKDNEVIILMKRKFSKDKVTAIWSDSHSIVDSLDLLFNTIWFSSQTAKEVTRYDKLEKLKKVNNFEIKELKQENIGLEALNSILSKNQA